MIMSYTRVNWQNAPSTATPVNAENLNTMDKGIADAHSQLAEITKQVINERIFVTPPNEFGWDIPIKIIVDSQGNFKSNTDISTFKHVGAGKTYFVNSATGNDSNDGLTPTTALARIGTAVAKADADIVMVAEGEYERGNAMNGQNITKNISIIAMPGAKVRVTTHSTLSWTLTEGTANVYQATRSSVNNVCDALIVDGKGDFYQHTLVADIATCDSTPGSWYTDGSTVYVHTLNNRAVDNNIKAYLNVYNMRTTVSGNILYLEGIDLEGGGSGCVTGALGTKVYAKNCTFKYAGGNGGVQVGGAEFAFFQNCVAARNLADGFSYHSSGENICKSIEINCVGRHNGDGSGATHNGSTLHDGCIGIRINGEYYGNYGPNIADVNPDTKSWNLRCEAYDSVLKDNFQIYEGTAWYEECLGYNPAETTHSLSVTGQATAYIRNCRFDSTTVGGGSTLNSY